MCAYCILAMPFLYPARSSRRLVCRLGAVALAEQPAATSEEIRDMATSAELQARDKVFIGGEGVESEGSERIDVINAPSEATTGRRRWGARGDAAGPAGAPSDGFCP